MRRLRLGFLATLVVVGVVGSAHAGSAHTGPRVAEPTPGLDTGQARTPDVEPSTPRNALITERVGTALLRLRSSDRGEGHRDRSTTPFAVLGSLVLLALSARRRSRHPSTHAGTTIALAGATARGPPLHLA